MLPFAPKLIALLALALTLASTAHALPTPSTSVDLVTPHLAIKALANGVKLYGRDNDEHDDEVRPTGIPTVTTDNREDWEPETSSSWSTGAIVGLVAGCCGVVLGLVMMVFWWRAKRSGKNNYAAEPTTWMGSESANNYAAPPGKGGADKAAENR